MVCRDGFDRDQFQIGSGKATNEVNPLAEVKKSLEKVNLLDEVHALED